MDDAELAADLVREAGRLAARMRSRGVSATAKTELTDIVTAADHAAEEYVVARLRAERPDDAIIGEEGTEQPGVSGRTWHIDPVDGTWNFFHGLDWWCSAIALSDADDVLLGAIHHPASDTTYVGGPDRPGTANGAPIPPLGPPRAEGADGAAGAEGALESTAAATYLHPPWLGTPVGEAHAALSSRLATVRMLDSASMDATAAARGVLGLSFQHSLPDWDFLPGAALVRSVGGAATRVEAVGVTWSVLGTPVAVHAAAQVLLVQR